MSELDSDIKKASDYVNANFFSPKTHLAIGIQNDFKRTYIDGMHCERKNSNELRLMLAKVMGKIVREGDGWQDEVFTEAESLLKRHGVTI